MYMYISDKGMVQGAAIPTYYNLLHNTCHIEGLATGKTYST